MARSPSPRRSKGGPGTPSQVTADRALGRRRRTPSPAKARGRGRSPKTPDDSDVIPFLSTTPTPPPAAAKKSPTKGTTSATKKTAGSEMASSLGQTKARRARRSAALLSPRARGTAIASILASPGDLPLAHGAAGIANRFVSPSQRSSAEAALNRLARGAKSAAGVGAKKAQGRRKRGTSLDSLLASSGAGVMGGTGTTPTVPGKRRRRKAASDASEKVKVLSEQDELDCPPGSADKIFYKKAPVGRRKKGDIQPPPSSSDNGGAAPAGERAKPAAAATTGGFMPKNKVDERWLRNFQKWTAHQKHSNDANAAALAGLSPLPKKWAKDQRAHYRRWMKEEKTNMTREKAALLEAAGFAWEGKSGRPGHKAKNKPGSGREENRGRGGKGAGKARVDVSPSSRKSLQTRFGSPERKSPRKSPPTQFYHNLGAAPAPSETGDVDTGKAASTEDGPKFSGGPTPGTPAESPSNRKSPRKSPPTQFYHNLGAAASSDDGKTSTARKSLLPKLNAVTTPGTNGSEESGSGSKKGRPPSPSKRPSVNSESLASVGAKGKEKKKKRRFRGSGGSASLSALGPMQFGELKQPIAKKAKGSLSYEELEAELKKKGKKRPAATAGGERAKKKQSAKKAKAKITKDGEGPAAKAQATSGVKESEEVAASHFSSVANKVGPPSSPPAENAPASSSANDASAGNEAIPEAVCVTKLLLSCLSEDSAEKAQTSTSKDVPQNTAEQEAEERGKPAATSSPTKDVVAEQLSQPQEESAPSPAVKKKRGRPRKHPLPSQLQKESAPAPQDPLAEEERPRSWTCDVCNEATFADYDEAAAHERECAKSKEAEAPMEQREEAANEEAVDSWTCDVCRKATFGDYDEAVAHERECRGKQGRARKQSSSLAGGSEADSQPTPPQLRAPVDETALAQFSPLSLTSPLQANNLMDSRYSSNGQGGQFPPSHSGGTQFHPVAAVVPNQTMNLVQNVNLNVSLPPGMLPTSEGHAQMILAERQYQEKMAEFGRLELEAKMVTDRMREIEERIEGIDSSAIAADVDAGRQIEETVSRKRSYRETHHYESSEADYSDEYRSPRKRRRRKRAAEETITMKRVKVRSSSSRRGDELSSRSSYDNEHIVLKSSSRGKKADRRRAYDSPDEYEDRPARNTPGSRKKSKAKRPAQVGRKSPSRLRKASPKRRQKSSLEVSGEDETSPHKTREEVVDEGSAPHDDDASKHPPEEKKLDKTSEVPPAGDQGDQKGEAANSNAKAKDGNDESGPSQQPAQARDPLYWLAGGENSSDDESWDFDGPMILPPPPIG